SATQRESSISARPSGCFPTSITPGVTVISSARVIPGRSRVKAAKLEAKFFMPAVNHASLRRESRFRTGPDSVAHLRPRSRDFDYPLALPPPTMSLMNIPPAPARLPRLVRGMALLCVLVFSLTLRAAEGERPNFLFIIFDDMSWNTAGAYGCDWVKTPNLDRVAREGVKFEHAFTSNPKC